MVFLTLSRISSTITKWVGPSVFRTGLYLRSKLVVGSSNDAATPARNNNNYWIDMMFLIPYSQKVLSLAIYEETKLRIEDFYRELQDKNDKVIAVNDDDPEITKLNKLEQYTTSTVSHTKQISELRLNVLEDILRPSLLPNELWGIDVEDKWRYNIRLVSWIRKEYLVAKYSPYISEALVAYPQIRQSPQIQTPTQRQFLLNIMNRGIFTTSTSNNDHISDHDNTSNTTANVDTSTSISSATRNKNTNTYFKLPSSDMVVKAFNMKSWTNEKNTQRYVSIKTYLWIGIVVYSTIFC